MKKLNGKTLEGSYINAARHSGALVDYPTSERIEVELNGEKFNRCVHRRVLWRNMCESNVIAEFVIIDGKSLEVEDMESVPDMAITTKDVRGLCEDFSGKYPICRNILAAESDRVWYQFVELCRAIHVRKRLRIAIGYSDLDSDIIDDADDAIYGAVMWYIDNIDYVFYQKNGYHVSRDIYSAAKDIVFSLEDSRK